MEIEILYIKLLEAPISEASNMDIKLQIANDSYSKITQT